MKLNILGTVTRAIRTTAIAVFRWYSARIVAIVVRTAQVLWTVVLLGVSKKVVLNASDHVSNAIEAGVKIAEIFVHAIECLEEEGANAVYRCDHDECFDDFCTDCRLLECQQGNISCTSCIALAFPTLSERAQELKREVDLLKDENKDLKDENKRLRTK